MGKQRTDFFKKCIIVFSMLMFSISLVVGIIITGELIDYGEDISRIIIYLLGLLLANIIIIIVLYFFWSVLKTLEEIREGKGKGDDSLFKKDK